MHDLNLKASHEIIFRYLQSEYDCIVCMYGWLLTYRKNTHKHLGDFSFMEFFPYEIMPCAGNISNGMKSNGRKLSHALGVIDRPYFNDKVAKNEFSNVYVFVEEVLTTIKRNDKKKMRIPIDIEIEPFFMYLIGNFRALKKGYMNNKLYIRVYEANNHVRPNRNG